MIRAAVFDIDGTLVDSVDMHAEAWQRALQRFGKSVKFLEVRRLIGKGGDQILPEFLTSAEVEEFGEKLETWRGELWKRQYMPRVRPFPRVRDLMQALTEAGVRISLASSAKADEVEVYRKLAHVDDLVESHTSADDVEQSKPSPDVFASALEKLQVPAEGAVAIGDSPFDAQAAVKIGLRTVGVLCGGFPEEQLRAAGCVQIFRDPADLLENIQQWTGIAQHLRAA